MGVSGLLPLLKSIQKPTELRLLKGETLGVDGYGWLHKGAISCARALAESKHTTKYVDYFIHRTRMLLHFGVKPYIVFDGDFLPSKAGTEASREAKREASRKRGLEYLKAGKSSAAEQEFQKCIDVTPEMARHVIEELKRLNIPYVVAPYEADPQLVYLEQQGILSGILSDDSDLLVFGAKRLFTKLDRYGRCIEINRRDFRACREITLTNWSDADFRRMAILSGCDYLNGLNGIGLKSAYRLLRKHKTPERIVQMLQFEGKAKVPENYLQDFYQAELTFLHQRVYCPTKRKLVMLTENPSRDTKEMPYIGNHYDDEIARGVAAGDVHPMTKRPILIQTKGGNHTSHTTESPSRKRRAQSLLSPVSTPQVALTPSGRPCLSSTPANNNNKSITSFFPPSAPSASCSRIPMGEMDRNCFSADRKQVASLTQSGTQPRVFPLPRPYVENPSGPSTPTPTLPSHSNSFRRNSDTHPDQRTSIYAPSPRTPTLSAKTQPMATTLARLQDSPRRTTIGPIPPVNSSPHTELSTPPLAKKAKLCAEADSSGGSRMDAIQGSSTKSPYFSSNKPKTSTTPKSQIPMTLKEDDATLKQTPDRVSTPLKRAASCLQEGSYVDVSVDDVSLSMPELISFPTSKPKEAIIFQDTVGPSSQSTVSTDGDRYSDSSQPFTTGVVNTPPSSLSSDEGTPSAAKVEERPSVNLSRFLHRGKSSGLSGGSLSRSASQPQLSTAPSRLTPLQRLGARALKGPRPMVTPSSSLYRPTSSQDLGSFSFEVTTSSSLLPTSTHSSSIESSQGSEDLLPYIDDVQDRENDATDELTEEGNFTAIDLSQYVYT